MSRFDRRGPRWLLLALLLLQISIPSGHLLGADLPVREVFIYYANENAPDETEARNYETIIHWLRSKGHDACDEIAGQLERDMRAFRAAVDHEIAVLERLVTHSPNSPDVLIFTNRLVRSGKFLACSRGERKFHECDFAPPDSENYIVRSSPLSDAGTFFRVLRVISEYFPAESHTFVLVTKSHGSKKMSLTSRLAVRCEETTREELLAVASGDLPHDCLPAWVGRLGITKERYLSLLKEAGELLGMHFSCVVMESCDGAMDAHLRAQLPANVERLFEIDKFKSHYRNIDYTAAFRRLSSSGSFANVICGLLAEEEFTVITHEPLSNVDVAAVAPNIPSRVPALPYFVPLALWIIAAAVWHASGRR